jgi:hypothetical protein
VRRANNGILSLLSSDSGLRSAWQFPNETQPLLLLHSKIALSWPGTNIAQRIPIRLSHAKTQASLYLLSGAGSERRTRQAHAMQGVPGFLQIFFILVDNKGRPTLHLAHTGLVEIGGLAQSGLLLTPP